MAGPEPEADYIDDDDEDGNDFSGNKFTPAREKNSKAPSTGARIRTRFPETWLWSEEMTE